MFIATFTRSVCREASGRLAQEQAASVALDGGPEVPAPGEGAGAPTEGAAPARGLPGRQGLRVPLGPWEEAPWLEMGPFMHHAAW